ncbi:MAG: hypothetical protein C4538_12520 [Nitrospiraceae bacterium]|nr:MAG: hypothetical protein C4538_12520 [Nitrospiraceae bacterium]
MDRRQIVFIIVLFVLLTASIFVKYVLAGSFNAELRDDGIVTLSGSESFDCVPEGQGYGSMAVVTLFTGPTSHSGYIIYTISSESSSVNFSDVEHNIACGYPGKYTYRVSYSGGSWYDTVNDGRACIMSGNGSGPYYNYVNLPEGREVNIESNHRVNTVETIHVFYNFPHSAALVDNDRHISVRIDNTLVYSKLNLPLNGSIPITYDFSNKKGFVLIKVLAGCGGYNRTVEKLVYVDPEDNCPLNVGKPVNVASGNVYLSETDFTLKGVMPITFTRYYDSSENLSRGFGQGWGHTYDTRVIQFPNSTGNTYKVINPDGFNVYYIDNDGDSIYDVEFPKGEKSRLVKNNNTFTREFFDGNKEEFNSDGYMTALVDRNGNRITLIRGTSNKLTQIADPSGRIIAVSYYPASSTKISSITLPDGRTINYTYGTYLSKVTYPDSEERNYEYVYKTGAGWKLSGIKNENGHYIEKHDYDAKGRATTSSSDGTNKKLTINYLSDIQSTVTDSLGRMTIYTFDKTLGASHATHISGPGCKSCEQGDTTYIYDTNMNITSITDPKGNITVMTYDTNGNMLTKTEAYRTDHEMTTTYTYNSFGQVLTVTGNNGIMTNYVYDAMGNMLAKTEAFGTIDERTTTYKYNEYGQVLATVDPAGNTTTNTYNQFGNLASVTNALGQTITYTYDIIGNLLTTVDANGNTTTYEYDLIDRLTRESKPDGGSINYEYDPAGNRTFVTDANGNRTTYIYDNINRLIELRTPNSERTTYTYDTEGNMLSMIISDASNNIITSEAYTYNDYNRLTRNTHADGTYAEQTYDVNSNILSKKDENGNITSYSYDELNRLISVSDPNGGNTSYTRDNGNNLTTITDVNGNITTYIYDNLNRLISTISPDTGTTIYAYDANDNIISRTDANGTTITYSYDSLNRLSELRTPNSILTTFAYDNCLNGKGKLCMITDQSGTTWYDYNNMGRILTETKQIDGINYLTEYSYNLIGNISQITYPGERKITYAYDQNNKVVSVSETHLGATKILAEHITYLPMGDVTSMTYGNGVTVARGYDDRNNPASLVTHNSKLQTLTSLLYSRNYAGDITAITDNINPVKSRSYAYDNLHRLALATGPWGSTAYAYDPVGNRTYETTDTGNTTYIYSANKLISAAGEKTLDFSYDNNGNTVAENGKQYIYNQNQRLVQIKDTENVLSEYVYNSKGQRVKKTAHGQTIIFHYDQTGLLIAESTGTGTITNEYVYLNGKPLAKTHSTVSGSGYNYPAPSFRASLSLNIESTSLGAGWLKYYYTKNRLSLVSTSITGFALNGRTATVTGTGTVNGTSGCTFTATITDSNPDAIAIEIRKPDGTLHYSSVSQTISSGNFSIGDSIFYYHNDHLGTPMTMTDSSGSVVWQSDYLPFGENISLTGTVMNNLRFPGQYYDAETGLHQNWHRDYKPEIGRYVEVDPILQPMISRGIKTSCAKSTVTWRVPLLVSDPQNLHPYVYTKGNAISLIDPAGLACGSGWTDKIVPDSYVNFDFTRPCENHDKCYDTCGKSQFECAAMFFTDMMRECRKLTWNPISQFGCIETAIIYSAAVGSPIGYPAYNNAQKKGCCKI